MWPPGGPSSCAVSCCEGYDLRRLAGSRGSHCHETRARSLVRVLGGRAAGHRGVEKNEWPSRREESAMALAI
jgi:hypothetical protein